MFDLKQPCVNCPFKRGVGETFQLGRERLEEIVASDAFQCHKTIDYDNFDDDRLRQGEKPQQCAGLMAVLTASGRPNTIMQVAERMGALDPASLDGTDAYGSIEEMFEAHGCND